MSEYQYYEFIATERPLTTKQMAELRRISTRAEITPTRFRNEYEWGDLKADPAKLVARYFDALIYFANWGTRRVILRLPLDRVDTKPLRSYSSGHAATMKTVSGHLLVDLRGEDEAGFDDLELRRGEAVLLASVRMELIHGDLRAAYLGWLLAAQAGDIDDDDVEPLLPPGMSELTPAHTALARFLRIDEDLLAAACESSEVASDERAEARRWVLSLSSRAKDEWLTRAIDEPELALGARLYQDFRAERPVHRTRPRSVAELRAAAELHRLRRERAEELRRHRAERRAAAARTKQLDALAKRVHAAWDELEDLVSRGANEEAMTLALDLRDLSRRDAASVVFTERWESMRKRQIRRRAFFTRWKYKDDSDR